MIKCFLCFYFGTLQRRASFSFVHSSKKTNQLRSILFLFNLVFFYYVLVKRLFERNKNVAKCARENKNLCFHVLLVLSWFLTFKKNHFSFYDSRLIFKGFHTFETYKTSFIASSPGLSIITKHHPSSFTFQFLHTARDGSATMTSARNIHFCASIRATMAALSMMRSAISLERRGWRRVWFLKGFFRLLLKLCN